MKKFFLLLSVAGLFFLSACDANPDDNGNGNGNDNLPETTNTDTNS
jgi:hypothetical protein